MHERLRELTRHDIGQCGFAVSLRDYSWWRIGGSADLLVTPHSIEQVQTLMREMHRLALPFVVIGGGSNVLFDDAGVRGVVVKIGRHLSRVEINGNAITAEAGIFVPWLIRQIGRAGLMGLEHAIGIPGTLGGLVLMNGGSMRQNVGSLVDKVWAVDSEGTLMEFGHDDCRFEYRRSALQTMDIVVVQARLRGEPGEPHSIRKEMRHILRTRRQKFPLKLPSCGSVFLSDPAMYATVGAPGKIIEQCGFKGYRVGEAMIPHLHANFIVNLGAARSADVLTIIRQVRKVVQEQTGALLMCEVRYLAPDCRLMPAHEAEGSV
jgi:UDP-N-acetylenolpyruvoylglucosamine reductase